MQINRVSTNFQPQTTKEPKFKGYAVTNNGVVYEEKNYGKILGSIGGVITTLYTWRKVLFNGVFPLPAKDMAFIFGRAGLAGLGLGTIVDYALNKVLAKKAEQKARSYNY